jgi:hypothetical protein
MSVTTSILVKRNGKIKVKFSLATKRYRYREVKMYLHSFLTSALNGNEWLGSRLGQGKNPSAHGTGK